MKKAVACSFALLLAILLAGLRHDIFAQKPARDRMSKTAVAEAAATAETAQSTAAAGAVRPEQEEIKPLRVLEGHTDYVFSVAFSPDGKYLASGSSDETARLWRTANGSLAKIIEDHAWYVWSVAFSPDNKLMATASEDETARLWTLPAAEVAATLEGHKGRVHAVAFSPDGTLVATASADGTVKLWKTSDGKLVRTLAGHSGDVFCLAFSPDGKTIASGGADLTVRLWKTADGKLARVMEGHTSDVLSLAFSPDGRNMVSTGGDSTIRLWRAQEGIPLKIVRDRAHLVFSAAFSPDGSMLATGSDDNTIKIWTLRETPGEDSAQKLDISLHKTINGHDGWVRTVAFSRDGKMLASGSFDNTVKIWKVADFQPGPMTLAAAASTIARDSDNRLQMILALMAFLCALGLVTVRVTLWLRAKHKAGQLPAADRLMSFMEKFRAKIARKQKQAEPNQATSPAADTTPQAEQHAELQETQPVTAQAETAAPQDTQEEPADEFEPAIGPEIPAAQAQTPAMQSTAPQEEREIKAEAHIETPELPEQEMNTVSAQPVQATPSLPEPSAAPTATKAEEPEPLRPMPEPDTLPEIPALQTAATAPEAAPTQLEKPAAVTPVGIQPQPQPAAALEARIETPAPAPIRQETAVLKTEAVAGIPAMPRQTQETLPAPVQPPARHRPPQPEAGWEKEKQLEGFTIGQIMAPPPSGMSEHLHDLPPAPKAPAQAPAPLPVQQQPAAQAQSKNIGGPGETVRITAEALAHAMSAKRPAPPPPPPPPPAQTARFRTQPSAGTPARQTARQPEMPAMRTVEISTAQVTSAVQQQEQARKFMSTPALFATAPAARQEPAPAPAPVPQPEARPQEAEPVSIKKEIAPPPNWMAVPKPVLQEMQPPKSYEQAAQARQAESVPQSVTTEPTAANTPHVTEAPAAELPREAAAGQPRTEQAAEPEAKPVSRPAQPEPEKESQEEPVVEHVAAQPRRSASQDTVLAVASIVPHQETNAYAEREDGSQAPLVAGKYRVIREIGKGGMAVVYEALDTLLQRRVAIKRMRDEIRLNKRERDRFLKEARTTARLEHPNIVHIYDIIDEDDILLVFEYIDGLTLDSLLNSVGKLPLTEGMAIARQVLYALDYAHGMGVVHRDLKPSNIMLRMDGVVKVMDFGIARAAKETVTIRTGVVDNSGTCAYMAPEQHLGKADRQSDIFAFGVTVYEMLTGDFPFRGPDFLAQKERMSFTPMCESVEDLPETIEAVVAMCLQADKGIRYHTPSEVLATIRAIDTRVPEKR